MVVIKIKQDRKNHYIKTPKILKLNQRTIGMKSQAKILTIIQALMVLVHIIILKIIKDSTPLIKIPKIITKVYKNFLLILMNGKTTKTILICFLSTKRSKKLRLIKMFFLVLKTISISEILINQV